MSTLTWTRFTFPDQKASSHSSSWLQCSLCLLSGQLTKVPAVGHNQRTWIFHSDQLTKVPAVGQSKNGRTFHSGQLTKVPAFGQKQRTGEYFILVNWPKYQLLDNQRTGELSKVAAQNAIFLLFSLNWEFGKTVVPNFQVLKVCLQDRIKVPQFLCVFFP